MQIVNLLICVLFRCIMVRHDKVMVRIHALWVVKHQSVCILAISTSSSDLLDVRIKRLRHLVMYDIPHVSFVYSHAKRYRCNYNFDFFFHPIFLDKISSFRFHFCMIKSTTDILRTKIFLQFFTSSSGETVDDTRLRIIVHDSFINQSIVLLFALSR
jgi:hypothetical protein